MPHHQPNRNLTSAPRGILKNKPGSQESRSPHLTWDEPNLALNDLNRDSTMKITEPKTPFVRYNAETDEVMNLDAIPDFDLGHSTSSAGDRSASPGTSSSAMNQPLSSPTNQQSAGPSVIRRASTSSRRGSDATERRQVLLQKPDITSAADDDEDEELDPDTKAKHDAFVRARKGHYGNEAEAMKRARELAEREEVESEANAESDVPSADFSSDLVSLTNGTS
ncbi:hypothetical protein DFH28DRAFT_1079850 [Melampsora americana]|nr:hypothetical protein DFH28DRAFT_1079850 [Melampsora americana]